MKKHTSRQLALVLGANLFLITLFWLVSGPLAKYRSASAQPAPTIQAPRTLPLQSGSGLPDGTMIIEGDIIVPVDFYDRLLLSPRAVWDTCFWPNGVVPYKFDANVTAANQQNMLNAMAEWEGVANVDFRLRSDESNYVQIRDSSGDADPENSSWVGMQGGEQIINIVDWGYRFVIAHELGHALGLWHEQSRSDRDNYVQIEWDCIKSGKDHNFDRHDSADVYPKRAYGLADESTYDFDSVMHYPDRAFLDATVQVCTRTITVLPPNQAWQGLIGQRTHLSDLDTLTMSFLYPESGWYFVDKTDATSQEVGTFVEPFVSFPVGVSSVPSGSTLWIQPGTYAAIGTYGKPVTLRAPLGHVTLGP